MDLSEMNVTKFAIHDPRVESIQDKVIADIEERKKIGVENYGTLLYTNNGRSMLLDLYEELLDSVCYLKGLLEEEAQEPQNDVNIHKHQISLFDEVGHEDHGQQTY